MKRKQEKPASHDEQVLKVLRAHRLGPEYRCALDAAAWWHKFTKEDFPVAVALREQRGDAELFNRADNVPGADEPLNAWRTGRELMARKFIEVDADNGREQVPLAEFWKLEEPPLALVNLARCRWHAYRKAWVKACHHVAKIGGLLDADWSYTPADAYEAEKRSGGVHVAFPRFEGQPVDSNVLVKRVGKYQLTEACARYAAELSPQDKALLDNPAGMAEYLIGGYWQLSFKDQKAFLKRTHRHSQHWNSARRVALRRSAGICSQAEFAAEMNCVFPQLSLDEKIRFITLCDRSSRPHAQKKTRLALLCAWLEHNAPVFSEFGWYREAIYAAAIDSLGEKHLPKDAALMFEYCSRAKPRIRLDLNPAPPKDREDLTARPHKELLEIPPLNLR